MDIPNRRADTSRQPEDLEHRDDVRSSAAALGLS